MSNSRTVKAATFDLLRAFGMTTVFGNPGSTELRFLRDWPSDFRYVTALQEASAVAMADGYAQVTRNAAFVNLHSAGGLGNAMGSIFTAYQNQTPLVITAGQQTRAMLPSRPFLYAQEATLLPQPYVKWSCEPARAEDVPAALERAYLTAMQRPFGPAFVSIPEDDWDVPAEAVPVRTLQADFSPPEEALEALVDMLRESRRVALIVGPGVDRDAASDLAVALAERTRAAVYVSPFSSRCSFPERHPLFAGFLAPVRSTIARTLAAFDVVLVLGAPVFTYHVQTAGPAVTPGTKLVQLTDDAAAAASSEAGTVILTTLRPALRRLLDLLPPSTPPMPAPRPPTVPPSLEAPPSTPSTLHTPSTLPARSAPSALHTPNAPSTSSIRATPAEPAGMSAAFALACLAQTMPRDAFLTEEAPSHRPAIHEHLPIASPGTFFAGASGSLGWALPAAVGIGLAMPGRRVVALLGDGSSMYSIQALWTAARYRLPLTVIVLNNGGYAAMEEFGRFFGFTGAPSFDLPGLDLTRIAQGFGCPGERVERANELRPALERSFETEGPTLVDIVVERSSATIY